MELVILWIGLAIAVGVLASRYDRSVAAWVLLAIVISPLIAGIILLAAGSRRPVAVAAARPTGPVKVCPRCAETVQMAALVCRYCGYEFPPEPVRLPPPRPVGGRLPLPPPPPAGGLSTSWRVVILAGVVGIIIAAALTTRFWGSAPQRAPTPGTRSPVISAQNPIASSVAARPVWAVQDEASKTGGGRNVYLSVRARDPVETGGVAALPTLTVRCMENRTAFVLHLEPLPLADHGIFGAVTFRIDDRVIFQKSLTRSKDGSALGLWSGPQAIPMIKGLFGGSTLRARIQPAGGDSLAIDFPIAGIEEAARPLRESCGW